jgi:hypothetical protein
MARTTAKSLTPRQLARVLLAWCLLLPLLLGGALVKRSADHAELQGRVERFLRHCGTGALPTDEYLYDWHSGLGFSPQGGAVYLLNHGYGTPELRKQLLLSEAQRFYDWKYLAAGVGNHDLRSALIENCLAEYPGDPQVLWAAGVCELAAGEEERAEEHLGALLEASGEYGQLSIFAAQLNQKPQHIVGRYCAVLTLLGKDGEAEAYLRGVRADNYEDGWLGEMWLRALNDRGLWSALQAEYAAGSPGTDLALVGWGREMLEVLGAHEDYSVFVRTLEQFNAEVDAARSSIPLPEAATPLQETAYEWSSHGMSPLPVPLPRATQAETINSLSDRMQDEDDSYAVDLLALTGNEFWLQQVEDCWRQLTLLVPRQSVGAEGSSLDRQWEEWRLNVGLSLVRGYVLTGQWERAAELLDSLDNSSYWTWGEPSRVEVLQLLTRIALGQPLEPAKPTDTDSVQQDYWSPYPAGEMAGPYASLRESDYLVALLRSPQFAAAVEYGGRPLAEVIAEVREVTRPGRGTYYDYSNGSLDGSGPGS